MRMRVAIGLFALFLPVMWVPRLARAANVAISIDASRKHQTIEGFGATTLPLMYGPTDNVPPPLRAQAIDALYGEVQLNMGNLEVGPFESPGTALYSPANDDADPFTFAPNGFTWIQSDNMLGQIVNLGRPKGFDNFWLGPAISETFEFNWATSLRSSDYGRYLDECGEHVAALAIHWRDAYGITPPLMQLWNEPIGGNGELAGGSIQELVDIVKTAGARLRREGFAAMRFVVAADETEEISLEEATAILADPVARPYVGAIAYHPYPYGSTYASIPNILSTSGAGKPDLDRIAVRQKLRDLGARNGIPVLMVEVSHSDLTFGDFDGLRGRAIHIHDEFVYADAAAYFGMNAMWDTVTNDQHFAGRTNLGLFAETDSVVLIDDTPGQAGKVYVTEMGHAIGHYARWVKKGAVRVEATSDDPLVQVTAFEDDKRRRLSLVLINNATTDRIVRVGSGGIALLPAVTGEQSTAAAVWKATSSLALDSTGQFTTTLPALSVTSFGVAMPGGSGGPDGGGTPVGDGGGGVGGGGGSGDRPPAGGSQSGSSGGCGCSSIGETGGATATLLAAVGVVALGARRRRRIPLSGSWRQA